MTKISKWGNSAGVRIPASILEAAGLGLGDEVELVPTKSGLDIRRAGPSRPVYLIDDLVAEMERLGPENRPLYEDWGILPSEWPQEDWSDIAPSDEEMGLPDAGKRLSSSRGR
jgi:antitoxin component of MazEF toxin-antitoxin module